MRGSLPAARPGRRMRLASLSCAIAAVALTLALAPAPSAAAHDYIVDTAPKANSVQTQPVNEVKLTFDDIVLDLSGNGSSSLLQVTGPDGASTHFETGCPKTLGRNVTVPVSLGTSGKYLVSWQIVSADGHTVSGTFTFSYQQPAGTEAATGTSSRPSCGRNGASPGAAAGAKPGNGTNGQQGSGNQTSTGNQANANQASTGNHTSADNTGIVIGIAGGIVGLAVIGVIIVLVTARKKPGTREPWRPGGS